MRRSIALSLAVAFCLGCAAASAQETLDSVDAAVRAAWDKLTSLSSKVALDASLPVGANRIPMKAEGKMDYLKTADKTLYRQEVKLNVNGPSPMEADVVMLFDGADLYVTSSMNQGGKPDKQEPALERGTTPPGGGPLLDIMKRDLNLTLLPDAELDGTPVYVIEGTPKDPASKPGVAKMVFYFDKATGLQRKVEIYESKNVIAATLTYSDVQVNPEISEDVFKSPSSGSVPKAAPQGAVGGAAPGAGGGGAG
jgi:hypothetical protein